ncbi:DUF6924 domain-containing protein [Planotetraspora mira]|uniref:DUF6924 domain-containing protein n=1 Tax=Planotetraspora mira TaxID=58121 RepID=A0A8J3U0C1_9ACTN|nr:hypothetical protein [Planotetraspora mira]GII33704.1 hypothetical protein Pmi06nite_71460 [Planotetraspora mira]
MKPLPQGTGPLVVRTDFSNQVAWEAIRVTIETPNEEGFVAYAEFLDDPAYAGSTADELLTLDPPGDLLAVVDQVSIISPEMALLVVDLRKERGRRFRMIATEFWGIENNLSISNMDFFEFADSVDDDGVFRGF